ncbi:MAG: hypothetical protein KDD69_18480, partial [Bdellovibrionales bacterium]|nr:hypothetical protein [Bdellovibrionales bacterium]
MKENEQHNQSQTVAFTPSEIRSLGKTHCLLTGPRRRRSAVLASEMAPLLAQLDGFKTIEQHAETSWSKLSARTRFSVLPGLLGEHDRHFNEITIGKGFTKTLVVDLFKRLAADGLFVPQSDIVETLRSTAADDDPITAVGIVTANRPVALERGLRSYVRNCYDHGRSNVDFFVCDDSVDDAHVAANKNSIAALRKEFRSRIVYFGVEQKQAFISYLVSNGIPQDLAEFAMGRPEIP